MTGNEKETGVIESTTRALVVHQMRAAHCFAYLLVDEKVMVMARKSSPAALRTAG